MTSVNWSDEDVCPIADSVSIGTDFIGTNCKRNQKKIGTRFISVGVTRCRYLDAFPNSVLELGIIEEVQKGPSGWISPLVVPKSDGEVCVYLCRANEAIILTV